MQRIKGSSIYEIIKRNTDELIFEQHTLSALLEESCNDLAASLLSVATFNIKELLIEVSCIYCEAGKWDASLETLSKLILSFPTFEAKAVMLKAAIILFRKRDFALARKYLDPLLDEQPTGFTEDDVRTKQ